MTTKIKNEVIDLMYLIIDINRVGSDEISEIEDTISIIENKSLKNITNEDKTQIISNLTELTQWSDRLGSDEISIINDIIKLLK